MCKLKMWNSSETLGSNIKSVRLLPPKQFNRFMLKTTCVLKVAILFELKLFTKNPKTYFMKLVQTIFFLPLAFAPKITAEKYCIK